MPFYEIESFLVQLIQFALIECTNQCKLRNKKIILQLIMLQHLLGWQVDKATCVWVMREPD